ncbi:MAG: T9SS type A sorting domain-containing protein, partial [Bacteroidota bacterium]
YQRPSFVTPPFAGYVSGHSTYSRAAAEVLTMLTGDPFFPGGMGVFDAPKNEFLVFEDGPSVDIELQWATYRDASDQTSLSRIWGGIHPPADDIPGRFIGEQVGIDAFNYAKQFFAGNVTEPDTRLLPLIFPNPIERGNRLAVMVNFTAPDCIAQFLDLSGKVLSETYFDSPEAGTFLQMETDRLSPGLYIVRVKGGDWQESQKVMVQ